MKQTKQTKQTKKKGGSITTKPKRKTVKSNRTKTISNRYRDKASEYFKTRMGSNDIPVLSALRAFTPLNKYTDEYLEKMTDKEIRNIYDEFKIRTSSRVKRNRYIRKGKPLSEDLFQYPKQQSSSKSEHLPYPFSPGKRSDEEEIKILERFDNESRSPYSINNKLDGDLFDGDLFDDVDYR